MNYLRKNFWALFCVLVIAFLAFIETASAQDSTTPLMEIARTKAATTFRNVKSIIFVVGGFGLVLLAFGAIFGKIKWSAFASLAVGLAILAAAGAIVNYATGSNDKLNSAGMLGDTFGSSAGGNANIN